MIYLRYSIFQLGTVWDIPFNKLSLRDYSVFFAKYGKVQYYLNYTGADLDHFINRC